MLGGVDSNFPAHQFSKQAFSFGLMRREAIPFSKAGLFRDSFASIAWIIYLSARARDW